MKYKNGFVPIYTFNRSSVPAFVQSLIDTEPGPKNTPGLHSKPRNLDSPVGVKTEECTAESGFRRTAESGDLLTILSSTNDIKLSCPVPEINKDRTAFKESIEGTKPIYKKLVRMSIPGRQASSASLVVIQPGAGSASVVDTQPASGPASLEEQIKLFSRIQEPAVPPKNIESRIQETGEIDVPLVELKNSVRVEVKTKDKDGIGVRNIKLVDLLNEKYKMNLDLNSKEFLGHRIVAHGSIVNADLTIGVVLLTADNMVWVKQHSKHLSSVVKTADMNQTQVFIWVEETQMLSIVERTI